MNIIYGLKDPRNDVYQYIGKSTVGNKRALQHLTNSHSDKVNEWVSILESKWLYPIVSIIEEVQDINDLSEREKYWINYYETINPNLLNIQSIDKKINNVKSEEDETEYQFMLKVLFKIPDILKKERIYRKLTQDEMAKEMKISRSTLSLCERNANVTFKIIQKYFLTLKGIDILTKSSDAKRVRSIK
ncbi:MAG: GIY-YIG nuclease family protein [Bacteroidia bacterium]